MKIALIGANGFIGSYFLEDFSNRFEIIKVLSRKNVPATLPNVIQISGTLKNLDALYELTKEVDIVVHLGFDHFYEENIIGIQNILNAMKKNNVLKLVYLSSYIVYKQLPQKVISEKSPLSSIKDIYTIEKINIELIISQWAVENKSVSIINLQPTIVYGLGGNWSNVFITGVRHKTIFIPNKGENICPLIYVRDVTKAILYSTRVIGQLPSNYEKFILNGNDKFTWKESFTKHSFFLDKIGKFYLSSEFKEGYKKSFGNSFWEDLFMKIVYSTFFGFFFTRILRLIKKNTHKKENILSIINSQISNDNPFMLVGLYKFLQSNEVCINTDKVKRYLHYEANFDLENGLLDMIQWYKERY